ncbi:MAG: exodeoxyribonuclease VII large subunit [Omnitrophica bacterium RIFCSPLOWO2_12_FULL_44_17]|uniref:Exodeoxyribonuclease 7 large subunit n=1 Tax=Candidatus Danuiimicrobium aquiferis TaxID=1801832 RepID=A0A1G1L1A0_9BACT|nr:MAG: exodeoxyribonuclease VII large subunit [Omnitrophica bacterium RIFCSPHIGHO2_02_FULL_45_28]OGW88520.1 MAG: exodeoxyribonuclease VII large subunit [Omnitrophica bacterium RIFCSPHIGHO2_12_FULL_44_12]OGW98933.1 MAG: exodeoxyribonuclease VII large subunit [Omnitrophica bacterium RIFCSPLOWO2_12_FULL_44_17]OGX01783.1 MAG: exodeoxyribonuclease VII large subunit [Omnitrophica bacterium RIFCSPLOWO2_02_FULL_44_11]
MSDSIPSQKIYKVGEITRLIRTLLENEFRNVWIEGEISNFKHHSSGHIYFTLKDEAAQINCVFFARENQLLKFEPKDGLQVITIGRISVYDQRGTYQIYVQRMEPKGLGALQLAFLQLKEKLEKEGLFDAARKKLIPKFPKRIGIVTSPTGAAIQDMIKVFKKCEFGLEVFIYPARVQGDGAALEIVEGLDQFNRYTGFLDLIIIGRGGGSLEDLWSFNEETVARAVARSEIPVISAIGHEVDWTIADFVADLRAHTPTAAAELVVKNWNELETRLRENRERMQNSMEIVLKQKRETFNILKDSYAFRQPLAYLDQWKQRVDELVRQMPNYVQGIFNQKKHGLQNVVGKLEALSPLAILSRGYSITFDFRGHVLKQTSQVKAGQLIQTRLKSGTIESKIIKVEE